MVDAVERYIQGELLESELGQSSVLTGGQVEWGLNRVDSSLIRCLSLPFEQNQE